MSHGITTEKTEEGIYTRFAQDVLPPQFDTLAFDFRGHGESTMPSVEVTIAGEILDLMAILRWAREQNYRTLSHLATSFGSSITLLTASIYDLTFLSAVVFWNPVVNYRNTFIDAKVEWGKTFFDQKKVEELAYRPFIRIPETDFSISARMTQELLLMKPEATKWPRKVPLLIVHGDKDTLVPFEDAKAYAKAQNPQAKFVSMRRVDHGFDDNIEEVMTLTQNWLSQNAR
jgi:pimeloyl-ACP methyl ester carboxylesterase